ncbi:MAG: bifunctional adenosylcobinamide kinase/adenosylcobinamide-phosphate guanylyltransferase [Lachnospiraceae bacterium]
MILIIGGAYQGKLSYALQTCKRSREEVYECSESSVDLPPPHRVVYHLERWILACTSAGMDVAAVVRTYIESLTDEIIVCEDISCGVVPMDPLLRAWRENVGRTLTAVSQRSDRTVRLFCGIPTILKEGKGEKNESKN